jgi:hypothetical protein
MLQTLIMTITMIITNIKLLFASKLKRTKMLSVMNTFNNQVLQSVGKHLDLNDKKIYALTDYELILGTTEILWEDYRISRGMSIPMMMIAPQQVKAEPEQVATPGTTKKTFH